jgi:hypothetical protein
MRKQGTLTCFCIPARASSTTSICTSTLDLQVALLLLLLQARLPPEWTQEALTLVSSHAKADGYPPHEAAVVLISMAHLRSVNQRCVLLGCSQPALWMLNILCISSDSQQSSLMLMGTHTG